VQPAKAPGGVAGRPGEIDVAGAALQSGGGGSTDAEILQLQARIDRLLLVYAADHPDVVALQRRVDQLYADRGPLSPEELAEARRQLAACWRRAGLDVATADRAVSLTLVLDRDGALREARLDDPAASPAVAAQLLAVLRGCGPLPLPPERYLLWQRLSMRVGAE
jgi:hypothetical protein